jgi:hypothetical protein
VPARPTASRRSNASGAERATRTETRRARGGELTTSAPAPSDDGSHGPANGLDAAGVPDSAANATLTASDSDSPLYDADGKPLPQIDTRPDLKSARFERRMQALYRAIKSDDPETAYPSFFPLPAYQQVKDIANPERDYRARLLKAFARNIHEYHRKLGVHPELTELSSVDVPEAHARFMKPGSEGNKLGYWRVLRSQIRYTDASKKQHELELTSLISWRGEWYVVHLSGFK